MKLIKQTLYMGCILWHPTELEFNAGLRSKMISDPDIVLSLDEDTAKNTLLVRKANELENIEISQVEVVLNEFQKANTEYAYGNYTIQTCTCDSQASYEING